MSDKTKLGDRMKWYEGRFTDQTFMPMAPVIARLDGRAFHSFTRGLKRPYDDRLSELMVETTKFLVQETDARCGYTQSDEISLVWLAQEWDTKIFFGGKLQKMASVLAATGTAFFNKRLPDFLPEKADKLPVFDCRVFQVPNEIEAVNCFIWREQDATRNSVQMAARSVYSDKECFKKNVSHLQEMLFAKGINWNNYPEFFKRGTYVRRHQLYRAYTVEELASLPEKHHARQKPDLDIRRTIVRAEALPVFTKIANKTEVLLHGAVPELKDSITNGKSEQ
jgi:tRNA(His) 5'-end guanylyltransferase